MTQKYYKHPKFGHVYGEVMGTPVAKVCWPALVKPKDPPPPQEGQAPGAPRYEATILLPKNNPVTDTFLKGLEVMTTGMLEVFNKGAKAKIAGLTLVADGDSFDMEKYPYYKDMWVLVARNTQKPIVQGVDAKPVEPSSILGGMQVKLAITPLITSHGASYKLNVLRFISDDGTRYAGGVKDMTNFLDAISENTAEDVPETASKAADKVLGEAAVETPPSSQPAKGKKAAVNLL